MTFLRMEELDLSNKRVLIREDLNVPIENGTIINDTRIRAALPSIERARDSAAQVIVMSHLGRPAEGKPIVEQPEYSLRPIANHLAALLNCRVELIDNYLHDPTVVAASDADLVLLENVRINAGEKANDELLASRYAKLCDVFVMDAFGTAHRAQASTQGVARFAENACAGPLLAGELDALERSLTNPQRPMLAIVGGAKVSSKLEVLNSLAKQVDQLIVGGGIANTFLLASGISIGKSLCEPELVDTAAALMQTSNIPLPSDVVVAREFSASAQAIVKDVTEVEPDELILDIGPETAASLSDLVSTMQTVIWNGPLGVFEFDQFANGTAQIAKAVAENPGFSIAGGGETIAAIDKFGVTDSISYISTGGGAFLEYMQGAVLPAVQILQERAANKQ
ncbi:MAG: phosphoglycerate kinase [Gammaproteobacteria bacterium]|nr:phosphoglycerate kinase [Gammaproteobacteria bacterium]MDP6536456.1 phosphoglycerate kinase [Gammaproteobacteria bacterium]MDP6731605.1 phosphoglycerate kinase [Gammaproteobacteria bacterium]